MGSYKDRVFKTEDEDGKAVEFVIKPADGKVQKDADFLYRKEYSRALRDGIMTHGYALKIIKREGLMTDEVEKMEEELRAEIVQVELEIKKIDAKKAFDDFKAKYDLLKRKRRDLANLTSSYSNLLDNTAESIAGEIRGHYIVSQCAVYKDSEKKIFPSFEDYINRLSNKMAKDCYSALILKSMEERLGVDFAIDEFDADIKLPEDKILDDYIESFTEEDTSDSSSEDEPEAKTQKKTKATKKKPARQRKKVEK